jgi:lipoprotein-releasing system permease protein
VNVEIDIALSHLLGRRRQTIVSLLGVVLGVAFFLAVSSLMRGSEADFIKRLIDSAPHITVSDELRSPSPQPAVLRYADGAVRIRNVKPLVERRGIRQYRERLAVIEAIRGVRVAPVLAGQVIFSFAGRDEAVTLSGIVPAKMKGVSKIEEDMVAGSLDAVDIDSNGVIIGVGLAKKLNLGMGKTISVASPDGRVHVMRIVGMFRTGRIDYDEKQAFAKLKRVQGILNRPDVANAFVIQMTDPYQARAMAARIEGMIRYKSVSWQESNEDLLSTLTIRNIIMYSVVGAILLVAAFGIYNVISTVVLEKTRDIAILKSMGFHARDVRRIFLLEGTIIGIGGSIAGMGLGALLMHILQTVQIRVPGQVDSIHLPIYWGISQFLLAAAFAIASAVVAAYLPARKGGLVQPVEILRGAL